MDPCKVVHGTTIGMSLGFLKGMPPVLRKSGFDVQIWTSPCEELIEYCSRERCSGHGVEMPRRIAPVRDVLAVARLRRLFLRLSPNIVHAHTPKAGLLGMIAAKLARVPVRIYHIHGFPYMTARGVMRGLLMSTERMACEYATHVLAVSKGLVDAAGIDRICPRARMSVLHHGSISGVDSAQRFNPDGIPIETTMRIRTRLGICRDAKVVGFVGRLCRDKGVVELLGAFDRIAERDPSVHLVIAGPLDTRDALPADVVQSLRTRQRVHWLGPVKNVAELYTMFDVLALPTYREGFATVVLESGAMGVPVVASRVLGCIDAVRDGVTGILVEPRNAEQLASAISTYLRDPDMRRAHGMNGRAHVQRCFVPDDCWHALVAYYGQILKIWK